MAVVLFQAVRCGISFSGERMVAGWPVFPDEDVRNGIIAVGSPGMAPENPVCGEHPASEKPVSLESIHSVGGAGWVMPAAPRKQGRDGVFV